jgi:hypothetical protein
MTSLLHFGESAISVFVCMLISVRHGDGYKNGWLLGCCTLSTGGYFLTIQRSLTDYDGVRLTSQNRGHHLPIVHLQAKCEWRAVVMMMPAGDTSWLVYQNSLAVIPGEISGTNRRNEQRNEKFSCSVSLIRQRIFTCRKVLRHGNSGFTVHPKECVLRIFIALKNPTPQPGLNPRTLGPVAIALTTTPGRRIQRAYCLRYKDES